MGTWLSTVGEMDLLSGPRVANTGICSSAKFFDYTPFYFLTPRFCGSLYVIEINLTLSVYRMWLKLCATIAFGLYLLDGEAYACGSQIAEKRI